MNNTTIISHAQGLIHNDSIADKVFALIEEAILSGRYPKGIMLTELALSAEYGVSRTPIREALRRLDQEKLVREHGRGIEVIGISGEDIAEIYTVRTRLEGLSAVLAAERITPEELRGLREILDRQEFYTIHGDTEQVRNADSAFHEAIYNACGNNILADILRELHKKIQLYRKTSLGEPERARHALREHEEIYAAIERGDRPEAERLVALHLEHAKNRLL
jgi:DNA-binding GntR family transcriptional regulator